MPYPSVTYRTELSGKLSAVRKELEDQNATLQGLLSSAGMGPDGHFGTLNADTINADVANIEDLNTEGGDINGTMSGTINAAILRLTPSGDYDALTNNDTDLLREAVSQTTGPLATLWYLNNAPAARNILGIHTARLYDPEAEVDGQVIVLINNGSFVLTFISQTVTDERQILGCQPGVPVGPGAMIVFVYDETNLGWRFVCASRTTNVALTDTDLSHALLVVAGSNLTAHRTLTVTSGDSDRTVTLTGNPTLADWFDQSVKTTASPTFNAVSAVSYTGSGASLTSLNASELSSGTVDDARLSANIPKKDTANTFSANQTVNANVDADSFSVNGSPGVDLTIDVLLNSGGTSAQLVFEQGLLIDATVV
jgi:hypothetical protein